MTTMTNTEINDAFALLASLEWKPFTDDDWMAFAGAGEFAMTAKTDGMFFVRSVEDGDLTIEAFDDEGEQLNCWQIKAI